MKQAINLSDSALQRRLETTILSSFQEQINNAVTTHFGKTTLPSCTFHFDFANEKRTMIGEIYTCRFPLLSGQLRKVKADILKMITYEQLSKTKLDKYYLLTINHSDLKDKEIHIEPGTFLSEHDGFSMFSAKSWFAGTLKQFDIKVLYYLLDNTTFESLQSTIDKQRKGMIVPQNDEKSE